MFLSTVAFTYLEAVQHRFAASYGSVDYFRAGQCSDFDEILKGQGVLYTTNPPIGNAKAQKVQEQMDAVKDVMIQNIEAIISRRDKVEILVTKTEELKTSADDFYQNAGRLKRKMWCKDLKFWCGVGGVALILIVVILMVICKPNFSSCGNDDSSDHKRRHISLVWSPGASVNGLEEKREVAREASRSEGHLNCHSIDKRATNTWCNANCNHDPPFCPKSMCECSPGPAPPPPPENECLHHEDSHQCYEACATGKFAMKGFAAPGKCEAK